MKKIITLAAIALTIGLTSCEKSNLKPVEKEEFAVNPLKPLERRVYFFSNTTSRNNFVIVYPNPNNIPFTKQYGFFLSEKRIVFVKKGDKVEVNDGTLTNGFILVDTDLNLLTGISKGQIGYEYAVHYNDLINSTFTIK